MSDAWKKHILSNDTCLKPVILKKLPITTDEEYIKYLDEVMYNALAIPAKYFNNEEE